MEVNDKITLDLSQISVQDDKTLTSKLNNQQIKLSSGQKASKLTEMRVIRNRTNLNTMRN